MLRSNPMAFFGYSDNTNLLIYLWNLGIIGFHGGSTMVHLARPGRLHPTALESMRRALFEPRGVQLSPAPEMTDENPSWEDAAALDVELPMRPGSGWTWAGERRAAVVVATPKAWDREVGKSVAQRTQFAEDQQKAILRALDEYNPGVPTVFGLDFGHTGPQIVIPHGGSVTVDGINRTVAVAY